MKSQLINSLLDAGLGITEESSWGDITYALAEKFPSPYYLYSSGNTYPGFTGGYTVQGTYTSWSANSSGCLYFYSFRQGSNQSGSYGYLRTVNPVQIKSGHKVLKCYIKSASQLYGQLLFYIGSGATTCSKYVNICSYGTDGASSSTSGWFTIDISSLEGNYYVGFRIASGGGSGENATLYVSEIKVE